MKKYLLSLGLFLVLNCPAQTEIIYDNTENYLLQYHATDFENGDQVELSGQNRLITDFAFEYFGDFAETGDETARVRFYLNDGPVGDNPFAAPGTLLYDSGSFNITLGYKTVYISDLSVLMPTNTFTFTVQFSGLLGTENAGILFYDPPNIGRSGDFFWEKQNGRWLAVASPGVSNNLVARIIAIADFRIQALENQGHGASVTANAEAGKLYSLEFKSSATEVGWQAVNSSAIRAATNEVTLTDPTATTATFRFYRVVERDLSIVRTTNQVSVTSFSTPGQQYALEGSTDFTNWTRLQQLTATTNTIEFITSTSSASRFFRVAEL